MSNSEIGALRAKLAVRPRVDDYRQRRKAIDARGLLYGLAPDVAVEPVSANGVRAEWTSTPQASRDAALLYLHGGGYVIGSLDNHRHLASEAGRAARAWALALDYRLAPEHPFPAAVEDSLSGYRLLLSRGYQPRRIAIAGDSAGGGLVVSTMIAIRDVGPERGANSFYRGASPRPGRRANHAPLARDRHALEPDRRGVGLLLGILRARAISA
jgi:acetyl esterase/lipase